MPFCRKMHTFVYSLIRTNPIWGYVYKDLIAAQSELQKNQKTVQNLISKLEVAFSPRTPSSDIEHCKFECEDESGFPTAAASSDQRSVQDIVSKQKNININTIQKGDDTSKRPTSFDNELQSELGAGQTSPLLLYTEDSVKQLIRDYIVVIQKMFPAANFSVLLLQTKISSLLLRTNLPLKRTNLPESEKVIREACSFLFPTTFKKMSLDRFWSNLKDIVEKEMDKSVILSPPTVDEILRREVELVLYEVVSQVTLNQEGGGCSGTLSCSEIEIGLLLDFIFRMYPAPVDGCIKTMLYNLDVHRFDLLSILSAIYIHFLLARKSEVGCTGGDEDDIGMSRFLEWVSHVHGVFNKAGDGEDTELLSVMKNDYFERNFEFKLLLNQSMKIVIVPLSLKEFFVSCNNGMYIYGINL